MTTDPTTTSTVPTFLVECHYAAATSGLWNFALAVTVLCLIAGTVAMVRAHRAEA